MCASQLELLQEDMSYATDEMERLSKVVEEQAALLEKSRTLNTEKENKINTLEEQVLPFLPQFMQFLNQIGVYVELVLLSFSHYQWLSAILDSYCTVVVFCSQIFLNNELKTKGVL